MKARDANETALDILSLPDDFYTDHFQRIATHWSGGKKYHEDFPEPQTKLLPSSLRTISGTDKHTLAALIGVENAHHQNKSTEFHSGGGLKETTESLFSALWNWSGAGPLWRRVKGVFGKKSTNVPIPPEDADRARLVEESYKSPAERDDRVGKWHRIPKYDTSELSVWFNPDIKRFDISVRGTQMNMTDIVSDLHILGGNTSGREDQLESEILDIIKTNTRFSDSDSWDYEFSGHSLGANRLMNILAESTANPIMSRVHDAFLYNPGLSPTHNLDILKRATNQDRFHFFLNSGDLISNTAISVRNADSKSEVYYGEPGSSPMANHSIEQWTQQTEV